MTVDTIHAVTTIVTVITHFDMIAIMNILNDNRYYYTY